MDLSPNYASTLMAITNGIGSLTGVLAPVTVGLMIPDVKYYFLNLNSQLIII